MCPQIGGMTFANLNLKFQEHPTLFITSYVKNGMNGEGRKKGRKEGIHISVQTLFSFFSILFTIALVGHCKMTS